MIQGAGQLKGKQTLREALEYYRHLRKQSKPLYGWAVVRKCNHYKLAMILKFEFGITGSG